MREVCEYECNEKASLLINHKIFVNHKDGGNAAMDFLLEVQ